MQSIGYHRYCEVVFDYDEESDVVVHTRTEYFVRDNGTALKTTVQWSTYPEWWTHYDAYGTAVPASPRTNERMFVQEFGVGEWETEHPTTSFGARGGMWLRAR